MGSELLVPMAHAVIGGLITSTLLTLVVVPVIYSILDDLRNRMGRNRHTAKNQVLTGSEIVPGNLIRIK